MIEKLIYFDIIITKFLKDLIPQNNFFDLLFSFFSLKGNAFFVWILVIIFALIIEERKNPGLSKKDKKFLLLFTFTFLISSFLVFYPLKNLFKRPRPAETNIHQLKPISPKCPNDYSFPSGHATTAFATANILAFFDKKRRFFYYTIAFLIAYSRVYLACHYFLDVLGGGVLGIIISILILNIFKNIKK